ncbi:MAG: TetR family transcriptional regulator C-terminal domain-containing protein [Isosphaeraceae bacterium]
MTKPLPKRDNRTDTRKAILEAGLKAVLRKGYHECGLSEILQEAGVPKGSFYYYFASKEEFGLQLIEHWLVNFAEAEAILGDESLPPMARVRGFFEARCRLFKRMRREHGSVVGTLYLEMATHNETFRQRVEELLAGWQKRLNDCLVQAQRSGEIAADRDPASLAEFALISWEGAVQRARTVQSTTPLDLFFRVVFGNVLTK